MRSMTKMLATVLFGVAIAGTPILAQTVTIDYDHSVNFLKFKTYTWDRVHATDPSVEDRITIAVNRDMSGRYMSQAAKNGDVTIAVVEATQDKQEYANFYAEAERHHLAAGMGQRRVPGYGEPRCRTFPWTRWSSTCTTPRPTS